jgi:endonuclease/exonuclease/phosphatase family metal-dependent hydrolase
MSESRAEEYRYDRVTRTSLPLAALIVLVAGAACAHVPRASSEVPLRVMTYNIAAGYGDIQRTAEAIRAAAPDLVALQEVDVHWGDRSHFVDEAATLAEGLGMESRFARIYQFPGADAGKPPREYGVAVLSRYPIVDFSNHTITRLSTQQDTLTPAPLPGFLEATINVRGTKVRVFNTHIDYRPDPRVRRQQVAEMLAFVGDLSAPTLLFGDLNAQPSAPEIQPLLTRLRDAWPAAAGPGFTYPAKEPVRRIDYVLTSNHFRVNSASVPVTVASDHRPVVVDLVVDRGRL